MPRPKQDQRIAMEPNNKLSMEPILQDFSITSLSEMSSEILPPSDSSLFEKVINFDVALPDLTLNQTNDVNLSSDQYPPDTTMMDISKMSSPKPMFKKPFISRPKRKPRPSLFEKDIQDSENDSPEPKLRKPFQRRVKVSINEKEFENVLNSSNDSTSTMSNKGSHLITRRRKRVKKNIDTSLFDKDLNSSESDRSFSLRRTLLRRKVSGKTITESTEFDEILDSTLNTTSQTDESQHKMPFRNRLQSKQKNVECTSFDSDLNSSNSLQDTSRVLICDDKERESEHILNENKTNCSINNFDNTHKNTPVISESKRLTCESQSKPDNVLSVVFNSDLSSSNSHKQNDEPQLKKLPFKNILHRQRKNIDIGLFDDDLNTSESFQESSRLTHEDKNGESDQILDENCALNNLDKDSVVVSEFNRSASKSRSNNESDSFVNELNPSYSLQLSLSLTTHEESESNNILSNSKQHSRSNISSESSFNQLCNEGNHKTENNVCDQSLGLEEGKKGCLKDKSLGPTPSLNSETSNKLSNCQIIEHSQEDCEVLKIQSNNKESESNNSETIESNINIANKSITAETNSCIGEELKANNLFEPVLDTLKEKSLLNIKDPSYNVDLEKNDSQNNMTAVLDENESRVQNSSLDETNKTLTPEFNNLRPSCTSSKYNILEDSDKMNEQSETCAVSNSKHESTLKEKLGLQDTYLVTRKSHHENSNIKFSIGSLQPEPLSIVPTKYRSNMDCLSSGINTLLSNTDNLKDQPSIVNCETTDISNPTLKKHLSKSMELRRSVRMSVVNRSKHTEQQSTSKIDQTEFSLFVEQSSKSVTSNSAFIDIYASKITNSSTSTKDCTSSNQAIKSISARDTSSSCGDVTSSKYEKESSLENNDQTSAEEEDELTLRMDEEQEDESTEEQEEEDELTERMDEEQEDESTEEQEEEDELTERMDEEQEDESTEEQEEEDELTERTDKEQEDESTEEQHSITGDMVDEETENMDEILEEEEENDEIAEDETSITDDMTDEEIGNGCSTEQNAQEINENMRNEEAESEDEVIDTNFHYDKNSTALEQTSQLLYQKPQMHSGCSEENGENSLSVPNLIHQARNSSFTVPNKPLRRKPVPKKPLPVPLNKTKVQEIIDNMPYSELKRKTRKSTVKRAPIPLNLPCNKVKIKRNKCITSTKLKKPQKWITTKFYKFIIEKLTPRFGIKSRVKAEKVAFSLVDYVNRIMNENDSYYEVVEEMKSELAELGIITTHLDFHELVQNYFDGHFINKLFPLSLHDVDSWNPFEPDDLTESILSLQVNNIEGTVHVSSTTYKTNYPVLNKCQM